MAQSTRSLPKELNLPTNLAGRLRQIREFRNMTVLDLARATRLSKERIEDLEAGLETWLSAASRQVISKALNVEPSVLLEAEQRPEQSSHPEYTAQQERILKEISAAILSGQRNLTCPQCGSSLRCSVQKGFDIKGRPDHLPRAFCQKCPFLLK